MADIEIPPPANANDMVAALQSKAFIEGMITGYEDVALIMERLAKSMPVTLRLSKEGQANLGLLDALRVGVLEKSKMCKEQLEDALKQLSAPTSAEVTIQ